MGRLWGSGGRRRSVVSGGIFPPQPFLGPVITEFELDIIPLAIGSQSAPKIGFISPLNWPVLSFYAFTGVK